MFYKHLFIKIGYLAYKSGEISLDNWPLLGRSWHLLNVEMVLGFVASNSNIMALVWWNACMIFSGKLSKTCVNGTCIVPKK